MVAEVQVMSPADVVREIASHPRLLDDPAVRARHQAITASASVCSYCGVGCPYTVQPDAQGQPDVVPLSPLGLCVKGRTSLLTGGDAQRARRLRSRGIADDRIRSPMIRGHDGKMKAVSWDEALDRAAWLFLHAREWVGPEAVAIYGNGQKTMEAIWMAGLYKLVFKLPTLGANSEHCLASAGAAHEMNFGNEASFTWREFDELEHCDVAVLHGTNPYITFPQAYEKLKRNRHAQKVVIDPVLTDTASDLIAEDPRTLHIRFRQGGDVLFNLAVTRIVLEQGWENREFLAAAVDEESLLALRQRCAEPRCHPEAVARAIAPPGVSPDEFVASLHRYAALIAQPRATGRPRVAFVSSMGINQSTGSIGFSTNLNLLLLTGNVGRRGAGSLRIAGQSNATSELMMGFNGRRVVFNLNPDDPTHRGQLAAALDLPEENIPTERGTPVARMSEDDRLYCFLFVGTQMTRNMPRLGHWMRRMGRAFNVVIDSFLAPGVLEFADVLLPSLTYTERLGVIQRGDRSLQLQQPITTPPPLARSDEAVLAQLALSIARRLRDPDTASLNGLDPDVVHRTFARYVNECGEVDASVVFDHMVEVSRKLNLYCRLEDAAGTPISHALLRSRAGLGVQWQGDGRYADAATAGEVFPGLRGDQPGRARLVCPSDAYLEQLERPLPPGSLQLISGRGRPGRLARAARGRYNSGIKTLPLTGRADDDYLAEIHPDTARQRGLDVGQPVRIASGNGAAYATLALNDRVPRDAIWVDFVPGEINRLTDYKDADRATAQSFIKRTPVQLLALRPLEAALWSRPDGEALRASVDILVARFRAVYPTDEDWLRSQRGEPDAGDWLHPRVLRQPIGAAEQRVAEAVGAMGAFIQRFTTAPDYRAAGGAVLAALSAPDRTALLTILLPILRRLDFQSAMHPLLAALVGGVRLLDDDGAEIEVDLLSAHKSAILEFKEEIVAIQLYVAVKRGLELLFGPGAVVRRSDLAFVSGVAIPCAGDVPAHFLGISPADLSSAMLVHSRAIGASALIVVDRATRRAVRVNITTGVLPHDRELTRLRGVVINKKRGASGREHSRFFDRLGELICDYIRTGDDNFELYGPAALDWEEYRSRLAFSPASRKDFRMHLLKRRVSPALADALAALGVLDAQEDAALIRALHRRELGAPLLEEARQIEAADTGTLSERVDRVVREIISPVLANDGGKLEILSLDEATGALRIRFVGSCANCPYSLLSMEQIVKPTLLSIPGIRDVQHRARMRKSELPDRAPDAEVDAAP